MRTIAFMPEIHGEKTPTGRHTHRSDRMNSP
jgi:hypothetical protein